MISLPVGMLFGLLCAVLWRRGLRRYTAVGG